MRNLLIILGLAGALAAATSAHAAFSDDFGTGQTSATNTASSGFGTGSTLLTSYGDRVLYAYIISNTAPGDARARTAISNGAFTFSSDDEVTGSGYATYDFSTPINLALTPAVQFTIISNDQVGILGINEYDSSGHSTQIATLLPVVASGSPRVLTVPLNSTGVNLASITKLDFAFGATRSEDLSVDSIVAVPEPGSLALLGVAAGAGWLIRRRRA